MPADTTPPNDPLTEQLVAYLDGELDADASRRIEELLAAEPKVREHLQRLERSWDLLDRLPRAEVAASFTQTTVEMIALCEVEDQQKERLSLPKRRLGAAVVWMSAAAATALVGFWLARFVWPSPNEMLLRDLAVIENLDLYQPTRDFDFLQKLSSQGLFAKDKPLLRFPAAAAAASMAETSAPRPAPSLPKGESIEVRRTRVAAMNPEEKEVLLYKQRRFLEMAAVDQMRLRDLQATLQSDPNAAELWSVMLRYHEWLGNLSAPQRSELLRLDDDDRLTRIQDLQREQLASLTRQLSQQDMDAVVRWMEQRILSKLEPQAKNKLSNLSDVERRRMVILIATQRWKELGPGNHLSPVTEAEVRKLAETLSPAARKYLDQAIEQPQKYQLQQLVMGWVRQSLTQFVTAQVGPRVQAEANEQGLKKFFEEELSESERERLLSLPAEEMKIQLRRAFFLEPTAR